MKPYLIAIDLDGTLLKDDKTIHPYSKKVITALREQGHHIVIATGRPFRASDLYYYELGLTTPIINFNGSYVHHPLDSTFSKIHHTLDLKTAHEIIECCHEFGVQNLIAESIDNVFLTKDDAFLRDIFQFGDPTLHLGPLSETLIMNPTCLLIHSTEEQVPVIAEHLSSVHAEVIDQRQWAAPFHIIEIVKSGIHKAHGLEYVSDHFDVPRERVIAFGDEDNDREMLQWVGHGVAMGNAVTHIKELAPYCTDTNENCGVARYLNEFFQLGIEE